MRHLNSQDIFPMLAALHSGEYQHLHKRTGSGLEEGAPAPFVTISRQAGAGGRSLATGLAARLNARDPGDVPWTVWDNELVERVAAEYHLPASKVAALENTRPSWLEEALGSLAISSPPSDEMTVFHRVATTIRALAQIGRVIIVGRGAAFVTAGMPGGVHVRLVAPVDRRIAWTARSMAISPAVAADWVKEKDAARAAFYRRHFPSRPLIPESFTATFNTAAASPDQLEASVMALVPVAASGRAAATTPGIPTVASHGP
jgi:hypothetical protein